MAGMQGAVRPEATRQRGAGRGLIPGSPDARLEDELRARVRTVFPFLLWATHRPALSEELTCRAMALGADGPPANQVAVALDLLDASDPATWPNEGPSRSLDFYELPTSAEPDARLIDLATRRRHRALVSAVLGTAIDRTPEARSTRALLLRWVSRLGDDEIGEAMGIGLDDVVALRSRALEDLAVGLGKSPWRRNPEGSDETARASRAAAPGLAEILEDAFAIELTPDSEQRLVDGSLRAIAASRAASSHSGPAERGPRRREVGLAAGALVALLVTFGVIRGVESHPALAIGGPAPTASPAATPRSAPTASAASPAATAAAPSAVQSSGQAVAVVIDPTATPTGEYVTVADVPILIRVVGLQDAGLSAALAVERSASESGPWTRMPVAMEPPLSTLVVDPIRNGWLRVGIAQSTGSFQPLRAPFRVVVRPAVDVTLAPGAVPYSPTRQFTIALNPGPTVGFARVTVELRQVGVTGPPADVVLLTTRDGTADLSWTFTSPGTWTVRVRSGPTPANGNSLWTAPLTVVVG
jgi:hypothetical protein